MLRHTARHWHKVTPEDGPLPDAAVELIYDALEDKAREGLRQLMGPAWAYRVMRVERDKIGRAHV